MKNNLFIDFKKYRWFYTRSGKLVIGGKSSRQNEELLRKMKRFGRDYVVMHTSSPGSPFSIILSDKKPTKSDLKECAVFTACFSQAWKKMKKEEVIDIFSVKKLYKGRLMKEGTWGVKGKIEKLKVKLELVLTRQEGILRAVPEKSAKEIFLKIKPGRLDKKEMLPKIQVEMEEHVSQEELMRALPPGGVAIRR